MSKRLSRTNLEIPSNTVSEFARLLEVQPFSLFRLPEFIDAIALMRLKEVSVDNIEVSTTVDDAAIDNVTSYNLDMLKNIEGYRHTLRRPAHLVDALTSISYIREKARTLKVLCIGPRTEAEFFMFMGAGFSPANLTGLDLMSYSEFVDVGDMHDMPYQDGTFNIVFLGWTLTYSKDIQRVADECRRVAKPGGYVAIGVESNRVQKQDPGAFTDVTILDDTSQILDLFEGHINTVPFRHDVHRTKAQTIDHLMVVIELE